MEQVYSPSFGRYSPTTFADLVAIMGLTHGTDVCLNNAQNLIRDKVTDFKNVIACRDDIMFI